MALVLLPGLNNLIEDISEEKKLPPQVVEAALREALLKGYERYRRTLYLGISEDPFEEDYFSNFDVALDLDEEGYRVLASKIIVEDVESEDHQISIEEVRQVADDAQTGDTVVLDVTPEKDDFGRMAAATTKQVLAQKLREYIFLKTKFPRFKRVRCASSPLPAMQILPHAPLDPAPRLPLTVSKGKLIQ